MIEDEIVERFPQDNVIIRTRCAAAIQPEPITWLWSGWLAAGKLHIMAGAPGTGKTTLALAFAAAMTTAGRWPDRTPAPLGSVLVWSGEDDATDTLVPRLIAMRANLKRVHFIDDVLTRAGAEAFDPARDMPGLSAVADEIGDVRLIILDPIVSAVAGDSHKNSEVRRALQPVVDLAGRIGAAVVGITHFTKGTQGREPLDRVTGSLAFGALARVVLATSKREDEEGNVTRILARAKSNIGDDAGGFEYDIQTSEALPGIETSSIVWGKPLEGQARELLGQPDNEPGGQSALREAMDWLHAYLMEHGQVKVSEGTKAAKAFGISDKTLRTARERLNVVSKQVTTNDWRWYLPIGQNKPLDPSLDPTRPTKLYGQERTSDHLKNDETAPNQDLSVLPHLPDTKPPHTPHPQGQDDDTEAF